VTNQTKEKTQAKDSYNQEFSLYTKFEFLDKDAIKEVTAADIYTKPNAVIVTATALRVLFAKLLA